MCFLPKLFIPYALSQQKRYCTHLARILRPGRMSIFSLAEVTEGGLGGLEGKYAKMASKSNTEIAASRKGKEEYIYCTKKYY